MKQINVSVSNSSDKILYESEEQIIKELTDREVPKDEINETLHIIRELIKDQSHIK